VSCVTSSSRGQSRLADSATSQPAQAYGHGQRRESVASRPIGLLSPNATSTAFSVHAEDNDGFGRNDAPAQGLLDDPGERSSILPDDMVR
jgi:hypothetical protein